MNCLSFCVCVALQLSPRPIPVATSQPATRPATTQAAPKPVAMWVTVEARHLSGIDPRRASANVAAHEWVEIPGRYLDAGVWRTYKATLRTNANGRCRVFVPATWQLGSTYDFELTIAVDFQCVVVSGHGPISYAHSLSALHQNARGIYPIIK